VGVGVGGDVGINRLGLQVMNLGIGCR